MPLKKQSVKKQAISSDYFSIVSLFEVRKNHLTIIKLFASPVSMTSKAPEKTNISANIGKKIEIVSRLVYWDQERLFKEINQR